MRSVPVGVIFYDKGLGLLVTIFRYEPGVLLDLGLSVR